MTDSKSILDGSTAKDDIVHYPADEAPEAMRTAAKELETRFYIRLNAMELPGHVTIASDTDNAISGQIEVLGNIVNSDPITLAHRQQYRSILEDIYRKLPSGPDMLPKENTLYVAPEREGRILAEAMGWLPTGQSHAPTCQANSF
jgi:hypothetical protein